MIIKNKNFLRPFYSNLKVGISKIIAVCFLLGNSPASEVYMPTFRNILFHLHRQLAWKGIQTAVAHLSTPDTTYIHCMLCCRISTSPGMNTRILIK
jgi:hypothetical protein